jgi:transposase-like protein
MEERLRFVARLLDGEGMSDLCREFGISRKTGYKIYNRYKDEGLEALTDRSRRPVRYANQLPEPIERMIVRLKKDKPHWGAKEDQGTPCQAACRRRPHPGQEHRACGSRPPWPCRASPKAAEPGGRNTVKPSLGSKRSMVR